MAQPATAKLTIEIAAEVCERTRCTAVVEGSITSLGNTYLLSVRARHCRTGEILEKEQAPAATKEDVFRVLDYGPAVALALLQDSAQVHEIAADLEARYPQDTSVQFGYLPVLRALDALNQGDAMKALDMTQAPSVARQRPRCLRTSGPQ